MSTRQISDTIEELYGFEVSDSFVSDVTDKILPQIHQWQSRPLDEIYPVVFVDATHYLVRDNGVVRKLVAYVILAIKKVLSIEIGENESAKYWLGNSSGALFIKSEILSSTWRLRIEKILLQT